MPPPPPPQPPPPSRYPPSRPPAQYDRGTHPPRPPPPRHSPQYSSTKHGSSSSSSSTRGSPPKLTSILFDEDKLPSRKDGISVMEERTKRRKTCNFLEVAGRKLNLPQIPIATAMLFFHHFFAKHSFAEHDPFEVAIACLLLAAKTEESPKKLIVVIQSCHELKTRGSELDPKGAEFMKIKESVLLLERVILHTIAFELSITHPYKPLSDEVHKIIIDKSLRYVDRTKNTNDLIPNLRKNAKNFVDESLFTSICLQHSPQLIATACLFMSAVSFKMCPTGGRSWGEFTEMDLDILTSIAEQIMDSVTEKKRQELEFFSYIRAELSKMNEERQRKRRRTM